MKVTVEISDLAMAYGDRVLFSGIRATARPGSCTVIAGPNGAGKSTILRIICGLLRPTGGEIAFAGDDGQAGAASEFRRRLVGYAGPDVNPYTEMSGEENVAFAARIRGVALRDAGAVLERAGIKRSRIAEPVATYSSGMRQRVRLAMSLLGDPPVVVWDEPTAMLDQDGREIVEALLERQLACGRTVFVATNDGEEAARWASQRIEFVKD
jgi:heme exporter protein A